jgi:Protein of unknown function (DUF3443)
MASMTRVLRGGLLSVACVLAAACGGGGDSLSGAGGSGGSGPTPTGSNVVSVAVTSGPNGNSINVLYTTVTVCVPGTTTCQTIDNIQVDTGSYGLRLLAPVLTLSLPVSTLSNGSAIAECTSFVDGYSWGPVALVDVQISGESASSVPVQLIGDSRYPQVPTDCSSSAPTSEDTVATFGANGILGIGPFAQDCGETCVSSVTEPIVYYACSTSTNCTGSPVPLANQVPNPVTTFTTDNNGTILSLSSAASSGAATVTGSLIFGIDTESNNASSGLQYIVPVDASGYITTVFEGSSLTESFIDSGSNAYFFNDSSLTQCSQSGFTGFYCPSGPVALSAQIQGNPTASVSFTVSSAAQLSASDFAFPELGGTNPAPESFDWGLPFFFGRSVATAIQGYNTSAGSGPYVGF